MASTLLCPGCSSRIVCLCIQQNVFNIDWQLPPSVYASLMALKWNRLCLRDPTTEDLGNSTTHQDSSTLDQSTPSFSSKPRLFATS